MAIYYVYSGAAGTGSGANWANAFTTLTLAFATEVAGDTLYIAHDHVEASAGALNYISSGTLTAPTIVICVNRAGSVPPVAADKRTTASISTTGAAQMSFAGCAYYDGIIFNAGSGGSAANFTISSGSGLWNRFDNCTLGMGVTTGSGAAFLISNTGFGSSYAELNNTKLSFTSTSQVIQVYGLFRWRNTASALIGTMPTNMFSFNSNRGGTVDCAGVDLSAMGSGKTICNVIGSGSVYRFVDCKLNASVTKAAVPTSQGACEIDFIRSGTTGNYPVHRYRYAGQLIEELTIVRTGGASDGTTPLSWKITTNANALYLAPFETPPIAIWNDTTGSAVTATVEGIWGGGAVPLNDEIWLDVQYPSDASSPQSAFAHDGKLDPLTTAANQTSSSETWGGSTTKFKLEVTFTAQQAGWIYARVKAGKASSVFYIDPLVTLS